MITSKNTSTSKATQFLAQLVMGFLEKQISPHTILDLFLTQLREEPFTAEEVSLTVCNAILEICGSIPNQPEVQQVLNFFGQNPDIRQGLSLKAALSGCVGLLRDPVIHTRQSLYALENFIAALLGHLHSKPQCLDLEKAQMLYNTIIQKHNENLLRQLPLLNHLKQELEGYDGIQIRDEAVTPEAHYHHILKLNDTQLAQKGLFHFGLTHEGAFIKWRLENIPQMIDTLKSETLSDFKITFLTEWSLDSAIKMALIDEHIKELFQSSLKSLLDAYPQTLPVVKGTIRSLQREITQILARSPEPDLDWTRCLRLVLYLYRTLVKHYSALFTIQQLGTWVHTLPHKDPYQLVQPSTLLWIQTLSQKEWTHNLQECPKWLSLMAEHYLAILVQIAPSFWLEKHLYDFFLRLQEIFQHPEYKLDKKNIDFVVFVIRKMRQKVPFFNRAPEPIFALKALGKCDYQERKLTELFQSRFQLKIRHPHLSQADQAFWENILARSNFETITEDQPQILTAMHLLLKITQDSRMNKRLDTKGSV